MELSLVNIHTHNNLTNTKNIEIINLELEANIPHEGLYSIGIHPWSLDDASASPETMLSLLEKQASHENVVAIGEAGLDKLHKNSLERQMKLFEAQILLSEKLDKPMILHAVKSNAELLHLRKKHKAKQTWIFHGFNGNEQVARQLTENGILLSVGESIFFPESKIHKALINISIDSLFFETDTSARPIDEIYEEASVIMELPMDALQERIFANFARTILKQ
jgi:Mg-dependent DNase